VAAAPFVHALIGLITIPLLLAAGVQALSRKTDTGKRLLGGLNLLPVPATAWALFLVLASVMPHIGLAQDAALRAAPIYLAFAVPGGVPLLPAVILTQTMVELCLLPVYIRWIPRLTR